MPGIWNPLPYFDTVKQDGQLGNIQTSDNFLTAAKNGTLPAVSWIVPNGTVSEHPPALVSAGQALRHQPHQRGDAGAGLEQHRDLPEPGTTGAASTTTSTPPHGGRERLRPARARVWSSAPTPRQGYIDHQTLSFDAYLKFIEDDFLGGQRLDPKTDGRPDPRPTVRENVPQLGDLMQDFDFTQAPRRATASADSSHSGPCLPIEMEGTDYREVSARPDRGSSSCVRADRQKCGSSV